MEASVEVPRRLEGEKAKRIIAAMRASVETRGAAGSTFDHVAREAGVSRGLLHYYFGSKERLLVEVVRHDCEMRIRETDERLAKAGSVDEILQALVLSLEEFIAGEPGSQAVIYEMLSASRRSDELRAELAELYRAGARTWPRPCAPRSARAWSSCRPTPSQWPRCCSASATAWASRSSRIPAGTGGRRSSWACGRLGGCSAATDRLFAPERSPARA
jgi:AcrR family transcriptional regulator